MKLLRHQSFSFLMISICRDPELPPFLSNPEDSPIEDIDLPVNGPGVLRPSRLMMMVVMMLDRIMEMVGWMVMLVHNYIIGVSSV